MDNCITVVYENGVLRPVAPLPLPEQTTLQIWYKPVSYKYEKEITTTEQKVVSSAEEEYRPTKAELWARLDEIYTWEPEEIEIPPRVDRPNPLLEMPDEFSV